LSAAVPQIQDGKLRALAVMSNHPIARPSDLPTIAEAGYPELDGEPGSGFSFPPVRRKSHHHLTSRENRQDHCGSRI